LVGVEKQSNKNTANGYVGLNADSKVDVAYLPSMLLNATYTIANQSAQLALLNINRGDIAIRTDENKTYLNITGNNTAMSDWLELLSPTNGVTSINGSTGAVILDLASVLTKGSNAAGKTITSLGTPVNSTDATNKAYVDGVVHDNQTLTLSGNTLTLERGGSSIDLSAFKDNTDGQTLSLAGNVLSITGGNNVNLSTINTDSQNLSDVLDRGNDAGGRVITGLGTPTSNNDAATKFYVDDKVSKVVTPDDQTAAEVPSTATGGISSTNVQAAITELDTEKLGTTTSFSGDVAGAYNNIRLNVGVVNSSIIADGSITTTDFSSMGATNGQVLKYNGTNWVPSEGMTNGTSQYNTLYWNGTSWVESSALKNNNTDLTASGDLVLNGGDLTTTATTASIFNSGATTLNIGSSATTTTIGSSAGTAVTTVNSNLKVGTVTADKITMNGGDFMVAGDAEIKGILWAYDVATASDQRLKANITTLTGVLEKINQLRGVSYVFKDQKKYATGPQVGLIAQELQKVYPELVSKGADGYLGVNYSQLTAVLVQAIKEQQKQISIQSELLAKQQQQINEIQKTLNALSSKSGGR